MVGRTPPGICHVEEKNVRPFSNNFLASCTPDPQLHPSYRDLVDHAIIPRMQLCGQFMDYGMAVLKVVQS